MNKLSLILASILGLSLALVVVLSPPSRVAYAAFHCMRIHAVMGGHQGNQNIQFVELRMDAAGQAFLSGHKLEFFDAAGTLKATFTFPSGVSNSALGESVLIATAEFNAATSGGDADFVFSGANTIAANGGDPLHPVQSPGGLVHFARGFDNCDAGGTILPGEVDSVGYGATAAHFGSPAPALPSPSTEQALRLNNLSVTPSNNSTEYALQSIAQADATVSQANLVTNMETPRNNSRQVLAITPPAPPSVGGVGELPMIDDSAGIGASDSGGGGGWVIWTSMAIGLVALATTAGAFKALRMRK